MKLLLAVFWLLQQVQVGATVDRTEVQLGGVVVLTIRVEAIGNDPVRILDPLLVGLELRGTSERTDVAIRDGVATRITTRELRLSPTRTGRVRILAVRVRLGASVAATAPIEVTVSAAGGGASGTLHPRIRGMIARRPSPSLSRDEVRVAVLASADSVVLGEQVDLAVVAWFPRQIRSRLRNPPVLQPPQFQGTWTYPQRTPGAVTLSRQVGGVWYDMYVHHYVLFPLTAGRLTIGAATVSYSLPLTYSFLSRELRHEVQSDSVFIEVASQPLDGRPVGFDGASAAKFDFTVQAIPRELAIGDAGVVTATLTGRGNVALWPEPRLAWPPGLRVYPEDVRVELSPVDGDIAGTKKFHYLVVADSLGTHRIAAPTYDYFDLETLSYVTLRSAAVEVVTRAGASQVVERSSTSRRLLAGPSRFTTERIVRSVPLWGWLLVLLVPPLAGVVGRMAPRVRVRRRAVAEAPGTTLEGLAREFRDALLGMVPDAETRTGLGLTDALRAAGVEEPVAKHAVRVRDRLWQAMYGAEGRMDPAELAEEVQEMLRALTGGHLAARRSGMMGTAVLLFLVLGAGHLAAQSAERLYEAGALRSAADSFYRRAEAEPRNAAHWHNLGVALHGLREVSQAQAAWLRAARLEPRNAGVRRIRRLEPVPDAESARMTWVSPITPAEAFLASAALWVLGWLLLGLRLRWRVVALPLTLAAVSAGYGSYVGRRYAEPLAFVIAPDTALRAAPYGPAPTRRTLNEGSTVIVSRTDGQWVLVERGEQRGWLLRSEIAPL